MKTETIDKLFLELSQVTKAKTAREIQLEKAIKGALRLEDVWLPKDDPSPEHADEYRALGFMRQNFILALGTD